MANPFQWASYQAPTQQFTPNPVGYTNGNYGFITPSDTKLPTGANLTQFLTGNGTLTPDQIQNRTVKYDGGLTREQVINSTGFLDGQLKSGFEGLNDTLQYGGQFGDKNSPVYSPTSQNGYGTGWGGNNPFKIGSF